MNKRISLSIVSKVSILAGSIAAIASLIVGSLLINGSSELIYEDALELLRYGANSESTELLSDIQTLSEDVNYLSGTPPIQAIPRTIQNGGTDPIDKSRIGEWENRLAIIFSELIRAKPNYVQIRYIGVANDGMELLRVDRKGELIEVLGKNELQKKGNTEYFQGAVIKNPGEVYLSNINLNREFDEITDPQTAMIRAAKSVYVEGELFGIVIINMVLDTIFNELVMATPRELTPYVVNEAGYFLAHPNRAMTFGFEFGNDIRIQTHYPDIDFDLNADLRDVDLTMETRSDVLHLVKSHFDPSQPERFLAVILATARENLQSRASELQAQNIQTMGFLVLFSLIVAALLAARLMRPLRLISTAADDLAHGREVLNLPVNANDEIGDLAQAFDAMRNQLEDKKREIIVSQGLVHHANKMSSLGEMAAAMAHEINSPIQAISLTADSVQRRLEKNPSEQETRDAMDAIHENIEKITRIVDSLRKVSRDSVEDEFADTSLADLIKDLTNVSSERLKVNDVNFEVKYHGISKNALIQCQSLQISQVLINLVNNAYDAIELTEDKWIRIDFRKLAERIQISVTDSGRGIPREILDRLFEPLFTAKEIGKGTGLGLSISKEIVANHHGLLYVDETSPNTRFNIELPIIQTTY